MTCTRDSRNLRVFCLPSSAWAAPGGSRIAGEGGGEALHTVAASVPELSAITASLPVAATILGVMLLPWHSQARVRG